MHERDVAQARAQNEAFHVSVREAAGPTSVDQLANLADLRTKGVVSDQEFSGKAKNLAG